MNQETFQHYISQINQVLSRQLFFIIGAQKSGTTWLQRILDAHPEVLCSGEGHFIDDLSIELAQVFKKYNNKLRLVADRVYEGKGYYEQFGQTEFDLIATMAIALMLNQRSLTPQIKCLGDKTPANTFHLDSLERLFPQAKYIHIVRDGRDVVVSHFHHTKRVMQQNNISGVEQVNFSNFIENSANKWVGFVKTAAEFTEKVGIDKVHTLRYEDLKAQPRAVIKNLCEFLKIDAQEKIIIECEKTASFEQLTGRKAGEENLNSFMRKGIVGDWQNYFDSQSQEKMEAIAGKWLAKFSYYN